MIKSLLYHVTMGPRPRPRRCLLYGPHGIGKSTWAAKAEGSIYIDLEDGLADIDCTRMPEVARSWSDVRVQIGALYTDPHDFKVLVVDTADALESLVLQHVCADAGKDSIEDFGYGKGYIKAAEFFRDKVLKALDTLRERRGMHIVLTAHSKIEKFEAPDLDSYDRYGPKLNKHISALIQEWADEVLFVNYRVLTRKTEEGFGNKRTLAIGLGEGGAGERVVWTVERPAALAKSRLNLPAEMPLEWDAYAEHFPAAPTAPADTINEDGDADDLIIDELTNKEAK